MHHPLISVSSHLRPHIFLDLIGAVPNLKPGASNVSISMRAWLKINADKEIESDSLPETRLPVDSISAQTQVSRRQIFKSERHGTMTIHRCRWTRAKLFCGRLCASSFERATSFRAGYGSDCRAKKTGRGDK